MSNNKQSMKLYTEEQVKRMMQLARETYASEGQILLSFTPIELPSDEEIWEAEPTECSGDYDMGVMYGFRKGALWMRDKIQGGNNE